ncbi:MAG: hypothetical protein QW582_02155 [Candidatus Micrarchaeaceae archaeon]
MKCAKHYCALVVKQSEGGISDRKLADFLENDERQNPWVQTQIQLHNILEDKE